MKYIIRYCGQSLGSHRFAGVPRSRLVTPCLFRSGRNEIWVCFLEVSAVFPYYNFIQLFFHSQLIHLVSLLQCL